MNPILAAILQAFSSNPALLGDLVTALGNLFNHPAVSGAVAANPPTPIVPTPVPAPAPAPAPAPSPNVFVPIPGKLQILGATNTETGQPAGLPFHRNTHIHLDNNLGNPLPWPESLAQWSPSYVSTWDGNPADVAAGSIDSDGYAGRFNVMSLSDTQPHTLKIALQLTINGQVQQGPWLSLPVQQNS